MDIKGIDKYIKDLELASINEEDLFNESDLRARAADMKSCYENYLKKALQAFTFEQLKILGAKGTDPIAVALNYGVIIGFKKVDNWMADQMRIILPHEPRKKSRQEKETGIPSVDGNPFEST